MCCRRAVRHQKYAYAWALLAAVPWAPSCRPPSSPLDGQPVCGSRSTTHWPLCLFTAAGIFYYCLLGRVHSFTGRSVQHGRSRPPASGPGTPSSNPEVASTCPSVVSLSTWLRTPGPPSSSWVHSYPAWPAVCPLRRRRPGGRAAGGELRVSRTGSGPTAVSHKVGQHRFVAFPPDPWLFLRRPGRGLPRPRSDFLAETLPYFENPDRGHRPGPRRLPPHTGFRPGWSGRPARIQEGLLPEHPGFADAAGRVDLRGHVRDLPADRTRAVRLGRPLIPPTPSTSTPAGRAPSGWSLL